MGTGGQKHEKECVISSSRNDGWNGLLTLILLCRGAGSFGFSLAASLAAYNLLDEYRQASAALQASVAELQSSTEKVSAHVRRIEAVEKDLKALAQTSASKDELSRLRTEMKKIYDGLHVG